MNQLSYPVSRSDSFDKSVDWASGFPYSIVFDDHDISFPGRGFPRLILAGARRTVHGRTNALDLLKADRIKNNGWLGGFFSYDLKNQIEKLSSTNPGYIGVGPLEFFEPEHVLYFHEESVEIDSGKPDIWESIHQQVSPAVSRPDIPPALIRKPDRQQYIQHVERIRRHIIAGDIYEMNYCMEFQLEQLEINPRDIFRKLTQRSPTPFSALARFGDLFVICASPERFLRKNGHTILSQPIKGTAPRYADPRRDLISKEALFNSEKERAENLMIVDLVRNDLARSAITGSVEVPELFGIYSFEHWHQMISSVSATARPDVHAVDVIRNAFPMGSMTGAPKIKVMELIDRYEAAARGVYSGALGFFKPGDDFDFNVVIRSIIYDNRSKRLSFSVGSAITYDSDPVQEYEECMLKASAILEVLESIGITLKE